MTVGAHLEATPRFKLVGCLTAVRLFEIAQRLELLRLDPVTKRRGGIACVASVQDGSARGKQKPQCAVQCLQKREFRLMLC
jgi:hypothetical protein